MIFIGRVSELNRTTFRLMVCFSAVLIVLSIFPSAIVNGKDTLSTQSHDTIKITISFPGLMGFKNQTISISEKKYRELERIFNETLDELMSTKTDGERCRIFSKTIDELKDIGVLQDNHAEKIKRAIMRRYLLGRMHAHLMEKMGTKTDLPDNESNRFCLVCGIANGVMPMNIVTKAWDIGVRLPAFLLAMALNGLLGVLTPYMDNPPFPLFVLILCIAVLEYILTPIILFPLQMFTPILGLFGLGALSFGIVKINMTSPPEWEVDLPSHGFVWTSGVSGMKMWSGCIVGNIPMDYYPYYFVPIYLDAIVEQMMENSSSQGLVMLLQLLSTILWLPAVLLYYEIYEYGSSILLCFPHGVIGYTGILIRRGFMRCGFFLGYASMVSLREL